MTLGDTNPHGAIPPEVNPPGTELLDPERIPVHVAIIMDGNGRWARAHGHQRLAGHNQGYLTLKEIVFAADRLGVRFLTVYGFSSENWRRPEDEVGGLMGLMAFAMQAEIDELVERRIRVRVSGRLSGLPQELQNIFTDAMNRTENFTGLTFNLAINYGGRAEVVDAVRSIAARIQSGEIQPNQIEESDISDAMYNPTMPDPDLLIRTAGEMRLSNFLLWQTAYSEIYVTPVCWPDFNSDQFVMALLDFQKRVRRFGAVVE